MVMYFNWKMWEIVQLVANTWTKRQWLSSIISASHQKTHIVTRRCNLIQRYFISTGNICCKSDFLCTDKSDFLSWQIWFASSQMFDLFQETWPTWKYGAMANLTRSIATKTSPKNWNFVKNQLDQLYLACCNAEITESSGDDGEEQARDRATADWSNKSKICCGKFCSWVARRLGLESLTISNVLSIKLLEQFSLLLLLSKSISQ